jgi:hypothetical protein
LVRGVNPNRNSQFKLVLLYKVFPLLTPRNRTLNVKWISIITAVSFFLTVPIRLSFGDAKGAEFKRFPLPQGPDSGSDTNAPNQQQVDKEKELAEKQLPKAFDESSQLGTRLSSPDIKLDNREVTQDINNAQMNQLRTKAEIERKVKNKEITKKQGEELLMANALAATMGFNQGAQGGQPSGQKQGNGRRSATTPPPTASPEAAQTDFSATTSSDVNVTGGLERANPRGRANSSVSEEIADTSGLPQGGLLNFQNRNAAPVLVHPPGDPSAADRLGANEARERSDAGDGSDGNRLNQATNGGGVGVAPAPGTADGDSADDSSLTTTDNRLAALMAATILKQAKSKKTGERAPASEGQGSVSSESPGSPLDSQPVPEKAARADQGMEGVLNFFSGEPTRDPAADKSAIRKLVSVIDEKSDAITGYKLTLWFVLFFVVGLVSMIAVRLR